MSKIADLAKNLDIANHRYQACLVDNILCKFGTSKFFGQGSVFAFLNEDISKVNEKIQKINFAIAAIQVRLRTEEQDALIAYLDAVGAPTDDDGSTFKVKIKYDECIVHNVSLNWIAKDGLSGSMRLQDYMYSDSYDFVVRDKKIVFEKYDCLY